MCRGLGLTNESIEAFCRASEHAAKAERQEAAFTALFGRLARERRVGARVSPVRDGLWIQEPVVKVGSEEANHDNGDKNDDIEHAGDVVQDR